MKKSDSFKNGCKDGITFIVAMALLFVLVSGIIFTIEFVIVTLKYWSILVFLVIGIIGNGINEVIRCK